MPKPARSTAWRVAIFAALGAALLLAWRLTERTEPPARELASPAVVEASPAPAPAPVPAPETAPDPPARATPPPVSAAAPPGCPEDDVDPTGLVRPAVWDVLRVRTQELSDRLPQLSRDASPPLRDALQRLSQEDDSAGTAAALLAAPDPQRDGFDVAVAGLLHLGMRALASQDIVQARLRAEALLRRAPEDPLALAFAALVFGREGDTRSAREHLRRAFALAEDEPAFALALSRAESDHGRFERARDVVDRYLEHVPEDARTAAWRVRLASRVELTRTNGRRVRGGIEVSHPPSVPRERVDALTSVLADTLTEVSRLTRTRRRDELSVVVYEDRAAMRRATCAPTWSGGIFDGALHLDAETLLDEARMTRTARHEATHAQLRTVRGLVPHWLDEGLAQHLEGPPSAAARESFRRMVERGLWIPFASLEGELIVIDDAGDAQLAYHQSLAMVLFLMERRGARSIGDAVAAIEGGHHQDVLEALLPSADGRTLLAYLATTAEPPP